MHQAEKTSKETAETTKVGLRTVQPIIKIGRIVGNHCLRGRNVVRKKILIDCDRQPLQRLVKSNRRKTTVELRAMFNSESKSISTWTMWMEHKGLGLNSCVALRKALISEANWKKGFNLLGRTKIELWSNGRRSCDLRVRRQADEVMHLSWLVPTNLWGQYYDYGTMVAVVGQV